MRLDVRWLITAFILLMPVLAQAQEGAQVRPVSPAPEGDTNSCVEGTIAGGLIGAGIGAFATKGQARWIGIPAGVVGGALLGCQIDGG